MNVFTASWLVTVEPVVSIVTILDQNSIKLPRYRSHHVSGLIRQDIMAADRAYDWLIGNLGTVRWRIYCTFEKRTNGATICAPLLLIHE